MKIDTHFVNASGFLAYRDGGNALNKVVYSQLVNWESCRPSEGIGIKYVHDGEEHYEINGQLHTVKSGQFLMVNHQEKVCAVVQSNKRVNGICLYIDPAQVSMAKAVFSHSPENLLDHQPDYSQFEVRQRIYPIHQSPFEPLMRTLIQDTQLIDREDESLFESLAGAIFRNEYQIDQEVLAIPAKRKSTREELHERLTIARSYILDNLSYPILVNDVARAAALSEFHFIRTFRQAFGVSPNQYMQQERIKKAQSLLLSTKLSITEIASQCGFSDLQYFSRTFKRMAGKAPSIFRLQGQ